MHIIENNHIHGLKILTPEKHEDERGFFIETYNLKDLCKIERNLIFVQDNHSLSNNMNTIRGLHFQFGEFSQSKLVRVLKGCIFDVAVDLRKFSPTFGEYDVVELSDKNLKQHYIPAGFAHGFLTLEPNTEVLYKTSQFYSPTHESGIIWNDPDLAIKWPISEDKITISNKDQNLPTFSRFKEYFL